MRVERRDPTLQATTAVNQKWEEPVSEAKPFKIPKRLVWDAYQQVRGEPRSGGS